MIVVCGEALMDVFITGDTPTGAALDARIGGSPLNVAVGLARMGQPVALFGAVSRDVLGQRLRRHLAEEGVNLSCLQVVDAPTTLGLVGLDAQGVASYAFYGHGAADRQLLPAALASLPPTVHAVHMASYALVVPPVSDTLALLVEGLGPEVVLSVDPNVRRRVEPDLARWRDRVAELARRADLLKLSDEDLEHLAPGVEPGVFARGLLEAGVSVVVLTRGGEGATAWTARHSVQAAPVRVPVVDTVGAGDTFQTALLTWLAEHGRLTRPMLASLGADDLAQALAFAARAAAITCSRRGADLPRRAELPPA